MTSSPLLFRYSNDQVAASDEAKAFSWEAPVPVNAFWDSFKHFAARSFPDNFSDPERNQLPINPNSADDQETKLRPLLQLLQAKLAQEEAATSPPQLLHELDYKRWYGLWQGIYVVQNELDLPEAEKTVRMLVDKRLDKTNDIVPPHMLSDHLVKIGKHKEAEETARLVCAWMDAHPRLGRDSPQAIRLRGIIARAVWLQGASRRVEAEALVGEIRGVVEGMGEGRFAVYQGRRGG
ncbi:hypothetical protein BGW36DRAFT_369179 [Talaromyces proteolyticus]|uniref:Uncharacterized protein n=1 Tax=Talaromyces proteolyticus TaxID=1131652 RepID=A0AAD4L2G4_9EURO|nr:uncharacterized protein BGW36DRAFT_369179 [Talaromyces proteolyticus]KAH8703329.1 hypothetical protein BGW36DRAFT_369179 [Talaromyces proteolyticus]